MQGISPLNPSSFVRYIRNEKTRHSIPAYLSVSKPLQTKNSSITANRGKFILCSNPSFFSQGLRKTSYSIAEKELFFQPCQPAQKQPESRSFQAAIPPCAGRAMLFIAWNIQSYLPGHPPSGLAGREDTHGWNTSHSRAHPCCQKWH